MKHFRLIAALLFIDVTSCFANTLEPPSGWWGVTRNIYKTDDETDIVGISWYFLFSDRKACSVRADYSYDRLTHIRIYKGDYLNGQVILYKDHIVRGTYADDPKDANLVATDPFHFYVGASMLVWRMQFIDRRRNYDELLIRLNDRPVPEAILSAANQYCALL